MFTVTSLLASRSSVCLSEAGRRCSIGQCACAIFAAVSPQFNLQQLESLLRLAANLTFEGALEEFEIPAAPQKDIFKKSCSISLHHAPLSEWKKFCLVRKKNLAMTSPPPKKKSNGRLGIVDCFLFNDLQLIILAKFWK